MASGSPGFHDRAQAIPSGNATTPEGLGRVTGPAAHDELLAFDHPEPYPVRLEERLACLRDPTQEGLERLDPGQLSARLQQGLQASLPYRELVQQLCVLERDRRLVGKRPGQPTLVVRPPPSRSIADRERPEHPPLDHEGHGQHGTERSLLNTRPRLRRERDAGIHQEIGGADGHPEVHG
jgi:hypothetical protein